MTVKRFNKFFAVFALVLLFASFFSHFASAQTGFQGLGDSIVQDVGDFFRKVWNNTDDLAVRVLFFILVFLVIYAIIDFVPLFSRRESKVLGFFVSLIVTALSVFFIPIELLKASLNPYTALGVTIITFIPFILIFVFVHKSVHNVFLRKAIWVFYSLVLLGITLSAIYDYNEQTQQFGVVSSNPYLWIYAVATLVAFLFIWLNQTIDWYLFRGGLKGNEIKAKERIERAEKLAQLKDREAKLVYGLDAGNDTRR